MAGHMGCMRQKTKTCCGWYKGPKERLLGRPRHRQDDDIKIDLKEIGW